jgi:hypothetical protein
VFAYRMKEMLHPTSFLRGLAVLLLMAAGPQLFSQEAAEAWARAKEARARAERMQPRSMRMLSTEYGKEGQVRSIEDQTVSIKYGADGNMDIEVLRALKDGKDVTEEKRKEFAKREGRGGPGKGGADGGFGNVEMPDPLAPKDEKSLKLGDAILEGSGESAVWRFPFEMKANLILSSVGFIRIDVKTGLPLEMEYSFKPLPLGVKRADMRIAYAAVGDLPLVGRVDMRIDSNLVFFRKKIDYSMEFSDYVHVPAKSPARAKE